MRIRVVAAFFLPLTIAIAGCSLSPTVVPSASSGIAIQGKVHGGQQPIAGARVYLLAANTTGYGGPGIAASGSNASVSLLTSVPGSTVVDASGGSTNGDYYVTTDSNGAFSITGDYICAPNTQVYLYALGGNPGAGTNSASGLLAALGNCPATGTFVATVPFIWINEVSTIAAAYAISGFATDATHVSSSGTALAQTGIANAFANAANLASIATGTALATTPAGNGIVPQAEINTLANILAACVNSSGPTSANCSTLFSNAMSNGSNGTAATDTATAAINVAHNPANVAALYLIPPPAAPFAPVLTTQPNDFTIALSIIPCSYLGNSYGIAIDASGNAWVTGWAANNICTVSSTGETISPLSGFPSNGYIGHGISYPFGIAIDRQGNAWAANAGLRDGVSSTGSVTEISSSGSFLSGTTGYAGSSIDNPYSIAIDSPGDAWVSNFATYYTTFFQPSPNITELSYSGSILSGTAGYGAGNLGGEYSIAFDGAGNAWVPNAYGNFVSKVSATGTLLSGSVGYTDGGMNSPFELAIDNAGSAWIANATSVVKLSNSGRPLSGASGFTGGGLNLAGVSKALVGIAIDGAGNAWITNAYNCVAELSNSGTPLSGATGYTSSVMDGPNAIAIDGSGDVWTTNVSSSTVASYRITELIGAAVPVITPIVAGLPLVPTGDGSSNLGTRP